MKIYATTTSERASKGQGGNEYLLIQVGDDTGKVQLLLQVFNDNGTVTATIKDVDELRPYAFKKVWQVSETKGKQQKTS